jgi:hypothetical protein
MKNAFLYSQLEKMLRALTEANVKVIPLKGILLAQELYPDPGFRPMSDIDLLLKESDYPKAVATLLSLGYHSPIDLSRISMKDAVEYSYYIGDLFLSGRIWVELHLRLIYCDAPEVEEESVWDRALPVEICGIKTLMPSYEDLLLHLCINANQHNFRKLRYFVDINELVDQKKEAFDWDYFLKVATEKRLSTKIYYGLLFARKLFDAQVPTSVINTVTPSYAKKKAFSLVWNEKTITRLHKQSFFMSQIRFSIFNIIRFSKVRYALTFLFTQLFPPKRFVRAFLSTPNENRIFLKYYVHKLKRALRL